MRDERFRKIVDEIWPKTKKELEKGIEATKKLIDQGEKQLRVLSEQGVKGTKKLSLSLQRDKTCYDLGKLAARTPRTKWGTTRKMNDLVKQIKKFDQDIKDIK